MLEKVPNPSRNSRIVPVNSVILTKSEKSYFAQEKSGIVPILTLRRTKNTTVGLYEINKNRLYIKIL